MIKVRCYLFLTFCVLFCELKVHAQQIRTYEQLQQDLKSQDTLVIIDALQGLADYYVGENVDSTEFYAKKAALLIKPGYGRQASANHKLWGEIYLHTNKLDSAQYHFEGSFELDSLRNDSSGMASSLNSLSVVSIYRSDYPVAIENLIRAITILKTINKEREVGFCQYNVGMLYVRMKNYERSEYYLNQSLQNALKFRDTAKAATISSGLVNVNLRQKEIDSAEFYLSKVHDFKKDSQKNQDNYVYFKGEIALEKEAFQEALSYFEKSLKLAMVSKNRRGFALAINKLAYASLRLERPERALQYLNRTDSLFKPYSDMERDSLYYATYTQLGDSEKALLYFKEFQRIKDSTLALKKVYAVNAIENANRNRESLLVIERQQGLLKGYLERNKFLSILIGIGILVFGFFLALLYIRKRSVDREKDFIENQYRQVSETNLDLKNKLERVSKKIQEKRKERPKGKYQRSSLSDDERKSIMNTLLSYMEQEKPYLDTEFSQKALSDQLDISSHHLSEVLNINLGKNFYSFINLYRVEEAKNIIENDSENLTMIAIAYDSGFNSKASFNRVFKEVTGSTPSVYKESVG
ncbi:helix-turn-helix domain-containing protein [Maribacter sp. 2210JD10-5]|uniref:helix-turn-helix domain-containing protein n=1 Tax=Maribacter sp. 2210JD10-5 TaxID=3386272 RepID=UPI0039BCC7BF